MKPLQASHTTRRDTRTSAPVIGPRRSIDACYSPGAVKLSVELSPEALGSISEAPAARGAADNSAGDAAGDGVGCGAGLPVSAAA